MRDKDFRELVSSAREAGQIRRGKKKASRVFVYRPVDVRDVRRKLASHKQISSPLKAEKHMSLGQSPPKSPKGEGRRRPR